MKVLYGVQGTGNGHITRARLMAEQFKARNIEVDWVFSGRAADAYFDMDIFGDYRVFKGLTFVVERGKVNYWKTFISSDIRQLVRDIRGMRVSDYDIIVNDFEPISAWAARVAKKSVVGISHQSAFRFNVPRKNMHAGIRAFMRWFAPVSQPIGLHWDRFDPAILPPMVDVDARGKRRADPRRILVYLPFASNNNELMAVFAALPSYTFEVYLPHQTARTQGNVHLHPFSRTGFQTHLTECESVICSAGFELPSECLDVGKRLLVVPVTGQAEQESNAQALQMLGYGSVAERLSAARIQKWLKTPLITPMHYPNVSSALVDWLLSGARSSAEELSQALWHDVKKPQ